MFTCMPMRVCVIVVVYIVAYAYASVCGEG